ncbi:tRNA lysidine(34) synthetase TilS [Sphingomonas sp. PB2P19]|uniref:tRNA lysidine(34) synthetase TilS n=1 Tax=Sphingomonas rhamnosi TaxID=3096156 RepID=UPI002FC8D369
MTDETLRFRADVDRIARDTNRPLLIAVSGGPDSMAMLALATEAFPGRVMAATVDHGLRAAAADEAAMVAAYCATTDVAHATLMPTAPIAGASIQAQARANRYALLADHARAVGAGAILTAHHVDDQAETFLMRAARGSGLAGLAGIRARTEIAGVTVLRPLLDWRRAELRAIVRRADIPFVDDPSNHDDRHDRTRFRRLLDQNEWLDPPHIAHSAATLAEADSDVRAIVAWIWGERAVVAGGEVRLATDGLPREVLRRLARRAIGSVRADAQIVQPDWNDSVNIERLLDALMAGKRATQAGVVASVRGGGWRFRVAPARRT